MIETGDRPVEAGDVMRGVLVALASPRHRVGGTEVIVPDRPGLYAIYGGLEEWVELGLGEPPDDRPLYVGKSESSLAERDLRTHFGNGRTGSSTVRRTFAALLHDALGLRGIPRNPARPERFANYGLSLDHDRLLTAWMRARLRLAVWPAAGSAELATIERVVLREWQPPLNLKDVETPWSATVREARRGMAAEARDYAAARGPQAMSLVRVSDRHEGPVERIESPTESAQLGDRRLDTLTAGIRPEVLAREIGMSAKVLRAWLRRRFPRSPGEHWQPWYLTHQQAMAAKAHFGRR